MPADESYTWDAISYCYFRDNGECTHSEWRGEDESKKCRKENCPYEVE